jgi:hypothetical protein
MKVPNFKDPEVTKFLVEMLRDFDRSDKDVLSSTTGNHSVLLISPSKKVFEVTVTDAGALVVSAADVTLRSRVLPR